MDEQSLDTRLEPIYNSIEKDELLKNVIDFNRMVQENWQIMCLLPQFKGVYISWL